MYVGCVAYCPLVSHSEYTDGTDGQTEWCQTKTSSFPLDAASIIKKVGVHVLGDPSHRELSPLNTAGYWIKKHEFKCVCVKGVFCGGLVRCPWHGACFSVNSGDIEDFPGLDSIPKFDVRCHHAVYLLIDSCLLFSFHCVLGWSWARHRGVSDLTWDGWVWDSTLLGTWSMRFSRFQ